MKEGGGWEHLAKCASIAVQREGGRAISGAVSCGLLFLLQAYVPLMGLGFGNPLLYANQEQCGKQTALVRLKPGTSTLGVSAKLQLHYPSLVFFSFLPLVCEFDSKWN